MSYFSSFSQSAPTKSCSVEALSLAFPPLFSTCMYLSSPLPIQDSSRANCSPKWTSHSLCTLLTCLKAHLQPWHILAYPVATPGHLWLCFHIAYPSPRLSNLLPPSLRSPLPGPQVFIIRAPSTFASGSSDGSVWTLWNIIFGICPRNTWPTGSFKHLEIPSPSAIKRERESTILLPTSTGNV